MAERRSLSTATVHADEVARFLDVHFAVEDGAPPAVARLYQAVRYSLLQEGGKRFRPVLAMWTAEALGLDPKLTLPFAAAVECVHTYSLIHDDLPAMDNDDFRRGQPSNHKKFDEATAILAGDGLLTEAFQIIAEHYGQEPEIALKLVSLLAQASGLRGMVGGQAIDMASKADGGALEDVRVMHSLKTGALIAASAKGAAIACGATSQELVEISEYAESLGLAFQVADDLLDFDLAKPEPGSYPALIGPNETRAFLNRLTETCLNSLSNWPAAAEPLREIAIYNRDRQL